MNTKNAFSQPDICTGSGNDLNHSMDFILSLPRNPQAGGQKKSPTPSPLQSITKQPKFILGSFPTQYLVFKIPATDFYPPLAGFSEDPLIT